VRSRFPFSLGPTSQRANEPQARAAWRIRLWTIDCRAENRVGHRPLTPALSRGERGKTPRAGSSVHHQSWRVHVHEAVFFPSFTSLELWNEGGKAFAVRRQKKNSNFLVTIEKNIACYYLVSFTTPVRTIFRKKHLYSITS
jgi:hypothetical protein